MKRIREYGIVIGNGKIGELNKITDVPGIKVGHYTVDTLDHKTGVTVIMPVEDNIYENKVVAAAHIINGFGKTQGLVQVEELGYIETPIALTNTLNVGKIHDGIIEYMLKENQFSTINPIVGECNDAILNKIQDRILDYESLMSAIDDAKVDFEEGDIGAGKGTKCLGVKGGIGSSSRLYIKDDNIYTIGVLVQSNFGGANDLVIDGEKIGPIIKEKTINEEPKGSIMIVLATDLPVNERQLKRMLKRTNVGLIKTGAYNEQGGGDIAIGFTTANRINISEENFNHYKTLKEEHLSYIFKMVADATEEAILNSLAMAHTVTGYKGKTVYGLTDIYLKDYLKNRN